MQGNSPIPAKNSNYRQSAKKEPLRFGRLTSVSGSEFADQLEEVALTLLTEMRGANVSKLVLSLHILDGDSAVLD